MDLSTTILLNNPLWYIMLTTRNAIVQNPDVIFRDVQII